MTNILLVLAAVLWGIMIILLIFGFLKDLFMKKTEEIRTSSFYSYSESWISPKMAKALGIKRSTWIHLVVVYDNPKVEGYIDGVAVLKEKNNDKD